MRAVLGPAAEWSVTDHLLAHAVYLLAAANWQRGGGKGKRPKPIKPPQPRGAGRGRRGMSPEERRADGLRRMRNLGLLPGHQKPPPRPLTAQERALLAAIERDQARRAAQQQDTTSD